MEPRADDPEGDPPMTLGDALRYVLACRDNARTYWDRPTSEEAWAVLREHAPEIP